MSRPLTGHRWMSRRRVPVRAQGGFQPRQFDNAVVTRSFLLTLTTATPPIHVAVLSTATDSQCVDQGTYRQHGTSLTTIWLFSGAALVAVTTFVTGITGRRADSQRRTRKNEQAKEFLHGDLQVAAFAGSTAKIPFHGLTSRAKSRPVLQGWRHLNAKKGGT